MAARGRNAWHMVDQTRTRSPTATVPAVRTVQYTLSNCSISRTMVRVIVELR